MTGLLGLLPELEAYPQVEPVDGLPVDVLPDGAGFLVYRLYEEPCAGFVGVLVVLYDEVLFAPEFVDVVIA